MVEMFKEADARICPNCGKRLYVTTIHIANYSMTKDGEIDKAIGTEDTTVARCINSECRSIFPVIDLGAKVIVMTPFRLQYRNALKKDSNAYKDEGLTLLNGKFERIDPSDNPMSIGGKRR